MTMYLENVDDLTSSEGIRTQMAFFKLILKLSLIKSEGNNVCENTVLKLTVFQMIYLKKSEKLIFNACKFQFHISNRFMTVNYLVYEPYLRVS